MLLSLEGGRLVPNVSCLQLSFPHISHLFFFLILLGPQWFFPSPLPSLPLSLPSPHISVDLWELRPDLYPWPLPSPFAHLKTNVAFLHTEKSTFFQAKQLEGAAESPQTQIPIIRDLQRAALVSHLIYSNPFPWWLPSPFGTRLSALSGWGSSLIIASLENGGTCSCSLIGWRGLGHRNVNHWECAWPYFHHSEIFPCQSKRICGTVNSMCH